MFAKIQMPIVSHQENASILGDARDGTEKGVLVQINKQPLIIGDRLTIEGSKLRKMAKGKAVTRIVPAKPWERF